VLIALISVLWSASGAVAANPAPLQRGTAHIDQVTGVWVLTPRTWYYVRDPSPGVTFALGSYPLRRDTEHPPTLCPRRALDALPADGVLVWVSQSYPKSTAGRRRYAPKPDRFGLPDLRPSRARCDRGRRAFVMWFSESGRYLRAHWVLGDAAPPEQEALALRAMSTLVVDRCAWQRSGPSRLTPDHGAPGDVITVTGPTNRDENGFYVPGAGISVEFNRTAPDALPPMGKDPGLTLAATSPSALRGRCSYALSFRVPSVRPGQYPVFAERDFQGGYGLDGPWAFEVTQRTLPVSSPGVRSAGPPRSSVASVTLWASLAALAGVVAGIGAIGVAQRIRRRRRGIAGPA
jgi:hypothetical protein